MDTVYFVIPCYNEEEVLPETFRRLGGKLRQLIADGLAAPDSRLLFVDDGSRDKTWEFICAAHRDDPMYTGLSLDQNRGHQTALTEGLMAARDKRATSVSIDADLQDDVDAIDKMLRAHYGGAHIVCGVRDSRETDTFLKRTTARGYYRIMRMFGAPLIYDHADFRLMDAEALDKLALFHGDDLFLRGLIVRLGYEPAVVYYDRSERFAGESKYTLKKMLKLAAKGVTSGRSKPEAVPRQPYTHTRELLPL